MYIYIRKRACNILRILLSTFKWTTKRACKLLCFFYFWNIHIRNTMQALLFCFFRYQRSDRLPVVAENYEHAVVEDDEAAPSFFGQPTEATSFQAVVWNHGRDSRILHQMMSRGNHLSNATCLIHIASKVVNHVAIYDDSWHDEQRITQTRL